MKLALVAALVQVSHILDAKYCESFVDQANVTDVSITTNSWLSSWCYPRVLSHTTALS